MKLLFQLLLLLYSFAVFGSEEDEFKGNYHSFADIPLQEIPNGTYPFQDVFKSIFVDVSNYEQDIKKLIIKENSNLKKKQILKLVELERRIIAIQKLKEFFQTHNSDLDLNMLTSEFLQSQYIEYEKEQYIACCCGNIMQSAAKAVGEYKNYLPDNFMQQPTKLSEGTLFSLRFCARLNSEKQLRLVNHVEICREILRTIDSNHPMLQIGNYDQLKKFADAKFKEYMKCEYL